MEAVHIKIHGIVQGVGFRPFVHRLVREHGLAGSIRNTSSGVELELEGERAALEAFVRSLPERAPRLALIEQIETEYGLPPRGAAGLSNPPQPRVGKAQHSGLPRHRDLRRLQTGAAGPYRPALALSLHQLHQLRAPLHHHPGPAL